MRTPASVWRILQPESSLELHFAGAGSSPESSGYS